MSHGRVSLKAPAKVNLYLKVTGRRGDGYHYLATLMQKISLFDRIDLEKTISGIELRCPGSNLPEDDSNLAYRAAQIFLEKMAARLQAREKGVVITLSKTIPVAAGLGGGSSDAAAVIKGLDVLFSAGCPEKEMLEMGATLGADVPFFVVDLPAVWATGIGDVLQAAAPLSGYDILVVNPGYSVSTPWVYEKFALTVDKNINNLKNLYNSGNNSGCQHTFLDRAIRPDELVNDLEKITASYFQEVDILKKRLLKGGAHAALMSGSGPTVFGLFHGSEAERATACEQELKREFPNTFLVKPLQC